MVSDTFRGEVEQMESGQGGLAKHTMLFCGGTSEAQLASRSRSCAGRSCLRFTSNSRSDITIAPSPPCAHPIESKIMVQIMLQQNTPCRRAHLEEEWLKPRAVHARKCGLVLRSGKPDFGVWICKSLTGAFTPTCTSPLTVDLGPCSRLARFKDTGASLRTSQA